MHGIILCAGKGTRLQPLTYRKPKPLVEVNSQPLIEYAFDYAEQMGVTDLHLVVGYKRGQIIDTYGDYYNDMSISYYVQEEANGLAHAVSQVDADINSNFLLLLSDILYGEFPSTDLPTDEISLVTEQVPIEDAHEYGVCRTDNTGEIIELIEKPENPPSNQILAGSYVLPPEIFEFCETVTPSERGEYELTDAINNYLHETQTNARIVETESWRVDVARPEDITTAEQHITAQPTLTADD